MSSARNSSNSKESSLRLKFVSALQQLGDVVLAITKASLPADIITFGLYRLKTIKQAGEGNAKAVTKKQSKATFSQIIKQIYQEEGVRSFTRGISPVLAISVPGSAAFVMGKEATCYFTNNHPFGVFMSGYVGQFMGSVCGFVPSSVLSEIMQLPQAQLDPAVRGKNALQLASHVVKTDGYRALYRGFWPQFFTFGTANAIGGTLAEYSFIALQAQGREMNIAQQFAVNAASYSFAGFITNPLDRIKTQVQLVNANKAVFSQSSFFKCGKELIEKEGAKALFEGAGFRSLWLGSRQAVFFTVLSQVAPKAKAEERPRDTLRKTI